MHLKMTNKIEKLDWWVRLACGVAVFRITALLVTLLFSVVVYVLPHGVFWRLHSGEPILEGVAATCVVVWFTLVPLPTLLSRSVRTRVILAIVSSVIAFCPVYLRWNVWFKVEGASPLNALVFAWCCFTHFFAMVCRPITFRHNLEFHIPFALGSVSWAAALTGIIAFVRTKATKAEKKQNQEFRGDSLKLAPQTRRSQAPEKDRLMAKQQRV